MLRFPILLSDAAEDQKLTGCSRVSIEMIREIFYRSYEITEFRDLDNSEY